MKKIYSGIMILTVLFLLGGCHGDKESGKGPASCEAALRETSVHMAETYRDIYFEAAETDRLHTPEVRKAILQCLGHGGAAFAEEAMVHPERGFYSLLAQYPAFTFSALHSSRHSRPDYKSQPKN